MSLPAQWCTSSDTSSVPVSADAPACCDRPAPVTGCRVDLLTHAHTRRRTPFSKVLIANRGEIAIRISRAASELGIKSAAIFSGGDERALHVSMADESVALPEGASYLDGGAVVAIAQHVGADCIHTGYGFLSENANFAALCEQQGLKFIGPSSGIYT